MLFFMLFPESPISTNNQPSIFIELITTSNAVTLKNNNGSTSQYRRYLSVYNQSKKCKIVN